MFGRNERDLEKELKFHIEEQVRQFMREGLDEVEARRRARLMFGGTEQIKELCRDERRSRWMEDFFRDCVYGVRTLRRSPAFTCAAVLSLALGMGANVAIFGLIDHVMLRMMPVRDPEYLVEFRKYQPPYGRGDISYPLFEALRKETRSFEGMFAHADLGRRDIDLNGTPEQVDVEAVSGSYHYVLGVDAAVGRILSDDDDRVPGDHPVAVISYGFWKRRFGGDPSAVGKAFRLNKTAFTIIGVTPPEFFGTFAGKAPDITFPLAMNGEVRGDESWLRYPGRSWLSVMARLRKDQPLEQARAEVRTLYLRRQAEAAKFGDERRKKEILAQSLNLEPGGNGFDDLRYRFSEPLKVLMGLVALVLAIACANVANLLLAKSAARQREIGVRLAIGAGRGRVIRQLLTEGLLLSALGGAAGIVLGYWLANALVTMMSNGGPRMALDVRLDVRVITFAVVVTIVSCLAFSLAPAIQGTRDSLQRALRQVGITSRWRLGKALVVAQLAISIVLLVGAGLFGRTLLNFYQMDAGFEREGVWMFSLQDSHDLRQRVLTELRAIPGVASAGVALVRPVSGGGWDGSIKVEGHTNAPGENEMVHFNGAGPGLFRTLESPMLTGRDFDDRDQPSSPPVVIVNDSFARKYFANSSPIGKRVFGVRTGNDSYEIIGVVKNIKYRNLRQDFPPTVYFAAGQGMSPWGSYTYFMRAAAGPGEMRRSVEAALGRIDRSLRLPEITALSEHVSRSLLRERMLATLAGFFGLLALALACVGMYGVVAFQAERRMKEVGIRMALGARPVEVIRMLLREAALLVIAGGAIGVCAAFLLARTTEKLVFGLRPNDPVTFAGAMAVLGAVAAFAAFIPGQRAARVNPADALRVD